jgi:hypothetical protein
MKRNLFFICLAVVAIYSCQMICADNQVGRREKMEPAVLLGQSLDSTACSNFIQAAGLQLVERKRIEEFVYKLRRWNASEVHIYSKQGCPVRLIFKRRRLLEASEGREKGLEKELSLEEIEVDFAIADTVDESLFGAKFLPDDVAKNSSYAEILKKYGPFEMDQVTDGEGFATTDIAAHRGKSFWFKNGGLVKFRYDN